MPGFRTWRPKAAPGRRCCYRRCARWCAACPDRRPPWCGDRRIGVPAGAPARPSCRHAACRCAGAVPELVSRDSDPAADAADLLHLARWARRYCPLMAPEQADSSRHRICRQGGRRRACRQRAVARRCRRGASSGRDPAASCRHGTASAAGRADGAACRRADMRRCLGAGPLRTGGTASRRDMSGPGNRRRRNTPACRSSCQPAAGGAAA